MTAPRIDLARARAHWHLRAGLAWTMPGTPDEVIGRTGWLRTLGGVDVYLAARARIPGLSRSTLDGLVEASRLRVVPAVRGCIYLVPAVHVPLALRVASESWRKGTERDLAKVGSSWKELEDLGRAITEALAAGPTTTDKLRRLLPDGAVRSFGEAGKKAGLASPLPLALRDLEFGGVVERTLEGGRLDTERYLWRLTQARGSSPYGAAVPDDAVDRGALLARIFAGFAGPMLLADFAWWAGLTQRDARQAIERAELAPIAVDGYAEEAWTHAEEAEALARPAEGSSAVQLLSFEDNYQVPRGSRWLVDPAEWSRPVQVWGTSKPSTLGSATHISTRTVIVGGELVGIWEMDPDAGQVLWATFAPVPRQAREAIDRLATETAGFLGELGHALSFSLDTEEEVRKRAAEVARVASGGGVIKERKARPAAKPAKARAPAKAAKPKPAAKKQAAPAKKKAASKKRR